MFARGVRRHDGDLTFDTSRVFKSADGWQVRVYRSICPSTINNASLFRPVCPQRLFGLMVADPADIGYTPLVLPGYTVDSLLGEGAFSTVYKAVEAAASGSTPPTETVEIRPAALPASLTVHPVLGDGNCFFHAIADQLQRQRVQDASGSLFTHESLRQLALSVVQTQRKRALGSRACEWLRGPRGCGGDGRGPAAR